MPEIDQLQEISTPIKKKKMFATTPRVPLYSIYMDHCLLI